MNVNQWIDEPGRNEALPIERFTDAGDLRTHYLDFPGGEPTLVLLHGLSANAHEFCALTEAGLSPRFRVVAPDLRGRGKTDKPATGYSMADHAADVIALLDTLGIERVVMGGHSFGGLLSIYLAAHFPERVSKVVVIDAAIVFHANVNELLKPSLARLARVMPSAEAYLSEMRSAPHVDGVWDKAMEGYFRAELHENADGTAQSLTSARAVEQALNGAQCEQWDELVRRVRHPVLLLNASGAFGPPGSPPLVPPEHALSTARAFSNCTYVLVPGNHLTMVFGNNAAVLQKQIGDFIDEDRNALTA